MRKITHIFLSLVIVYATTTSAYASSSWAVQSVVMSGAQATITAAKQGFRSVISHTPTATAVGKELIKGAGVVAVAYAASQLLDAGVDWVLDPANNGITYKNPPSDPKAGGYTINGSCTQTIFSTGQAVCSSIGKTLVARADWPGDTCDGSSAHRVIYSASPLCAGAVLPDTYTTIPIDTVAAKVISNADAGHTPSQEIVKAVATQDFNAGQLDTKLNDAAVPSDAPLDPTDPTSPSFDPSSIIAALQSLMSAITNMSSSIKESMRSMLVELGLMNAETNRVINDSVDRVIANDNVNVGELVAAIEAIEGNTLDGQVINDAVDRAIAEGKTDTASIVAAIEAIEGNTLDGQVINDAVDRVIANDNVNAQSTNDVVSQSIDKAIEAGQADATKVTDAVDSQTDAITTTDPTTGEKSLSLPSFCTWAGPVCTFIDWSKQQWLEFTLTFTALKDWLFEDAPVDDKDNTIDTPVLPVTPVQVAINFVGSCPAPLTFEYKIYNQTFKPSVPFTPICEVAVMINPVIKICASIAAIFIVAGIRQGNS